MLHRSAAAGCRVQRVRKQFGDEMEPRHPVGISRDVSRGCGTNAPSRTNLSNAYVTGMKEDVGFVGNDLTLVNSCFTAGYVVGQWPSAVILASGRIPPRVWFPFCVFAWGLCTLGLAFVTNPSQVMGIRFTMALFEASTFSGSHYILGSWYKDAELGKRTAVSVFLNKMNKQKY